MTSRKNTLVVTDEEITIIIDGLLCRANDADTQGQQTQIEEMIEKFEFISHMKPFVDKLLDKVDDTENDSL